MITALKASTSLNLDITCTLYPVGNVWSIVLTVHVPADSVVRLGYWVSVEAPITLLCICLPAISLLTRHLRKSHPLIITRNFRAFLSFVRDREPSGPRSQITDVTSLPAASPRQTRTRPMPSTLSTPNTHVDRQSIPSLESVDRLLPHEHNRYFASAKETTSRTEECDAMVSFPDTRISSIHIEKTVTVPHSSRTWHSY